MDLPHLTVASWNVKDFGSDMSLTGRITPKTPWKLSAAQTVEKNGIDVQIELKLSVYDRYTQYKNWCQAIINIPSNFGYTKAVDEIIKRFGNKRVFSNYLKLTRCDLNCDANLQFTNIIISFKDWNGVEVMVGSKLTPNKQYKLKIEVKYVRYRVTFPLSIEYEITFEKLQNEVFKTKCNRICDFITTNSIDVLFIQEACDYRVSEILQEQLGDEYMAECVFIGFGNNLDEYAVVIYKEKYSCGEEMKVTRKDKILGRDPASLVINFNGTKFCFVTLHLRAVWNNDYTNNNEDLALLPSFLEELQKDLSEATKIIWLGDFNRQPKDKLERSGNYTFEDSVKEKLKCSVMNHDLTNTAPSEMCYDNFLVPQDLGLSTISTCRVFSDWWCKVQLDGTEEVVVSDHRPIVLDIRPVTESVAKAFKELLDSTGQASLRSPVTNSTNLQVQSEFSAKRQAQRIFAESVAAAAAAAAPPARIVSVAKAAEAARQAEEDAMQAEEAARQAEEAARQAEEAARQAEDAARKAADEARKAADKARKAADEARKAAETVEEAEKQAVKQAEEPEKQAAEAARQAAEAAEAAEAAKQAAKKAVRQAARAAERAMVGAAPP